MPLPRRRLSIIIACSWPVTKTVKHAYAFTTSHEKQIKPLPEDLNQGSFLCSRASALHQLVRVEVTVQCADALAMVVPADGLREETAYVENDKLLDVLRHSRRNRV